MSDAAAPPDRPVHELTYEDARDELIAIVARLEAGSATLDESLGLWERGEALAARCQALLDGAQARIDASHGDDATHQDAADAGVIAVVAEDEDPEDEEQS